MTELTRPAQSAAKPRDLCERTFLFACDIVTICLQLARTPGAQRRIAGQLLDAGTSVGANAEEAHAAFSRADFAYKNGIVLREARESLFWLRVILRTRLMDAAVVEPAKVEANELVSIYTKIVRKAKAPKSAGPSETQAF